jgi:hypothetical protein
VDDTVRSEHACFAYEPPHGPSIFNPPPDLLTDLILRADLSYWQGGANGEAQIVPAVFEEGRLIAVAGGGHPSLYIKAPAARQFFLAWRCKIGWYSPFNGESAAGYIEDECGGNPFFVPRACLVRPEIAAEIVSHFLGAAERADVVTWLAWDDLPEPPRGDV